MAAIFTLGLSVLAGCGAKTEDPGEPPAEVINGESTNAENNSVQTGSSTNMEETDNGDVSGDEILANAISVRIGRDGATEWNVDMYNNAATLTMLDYLSGSALLFPTYTYDEEGGFVAQSVRGSYTRDDREQACPPVLWFRTMMPPHRLLKNYAKYNNQTHKSSDRII